MTHGAINPLIEKLGRASTPPVPESPFGITLMSLIRGYAIPSPVDTAVVVGTREFQNYISGVVDFVPGIPGLLVEQVSESQITEVIIESKSFDSGPWLGADSGSAIKFREEIFEAGRIIRARGGLVLLINEMYRLPGIDYPRIESTSNAVINAIPATEYEEEATNSPLWIACQHYLNHESRRGSNDD